MKLLLASTSTLLFGVSFTAAAPYQRHHPHTNSSTSPFDAPTAYSFAESTQRTTIPFPGYPTWQTTIYPNPTSISSLSTVLNPQPTSANTTLANTKPAITTVMTIWVSEQGSSVPIQTLTNPTVWTLLEPTSELISESSLSTVTTSEMETVTASASPAVVATSGVVSTSSTNLEIGIVTNTTTSPVVVATSGVLSTSMSTVVNSQMGTITAAANSNVGVTSDVVSTVRESRYY